MPTRTKTTTSTLTIVATVDVDVSVDQWTRHDLPDIQRVYCMWVTPTEAIRRINCFLLPMVKTDEYGELVKKSLGAILRGSPEVYSMICKSTIDGILEDVVASDDQELIAAFRDEIVEYTQEFTAQKQMPDFALTICSDFFRLLSNQDFEHSESHWADFLKSSFYVFRDGNLLNKASFMEMWETALKFPSVTSELDLHHDLLRHCIRIYKNGTVKNRKFEREALLKLIRQLMRKIKEEEIQELNPDVRDFFDLVVQEYAEGDLREGDYAEVIPFLEENMDYVTAEKCSELATDLCTSEPKPKDRPKAARLLYALERFDKIDKIDNAPPLLQTALNLERDGASKEPRPSLWHKDPPTVAKPELSKIVEDLERIVRQLERGPENAMILDCHGGE